MITLPFNGHNSLASTLTRPQAW